MRIRSLRVDAPAIWVSGVIIIWPGHYNLACTAMWDPDVTTSMKEESS